MNSAASALIFRFAASTFSSGLRVSGNPAPIVTRPVIFPLLPVKVNLKAFCPSWSKRMSAIKLLQALCQAYRRRQGDEDRRPGQRARDMEPSPAARIDEN